MICPACERVARALPESDPFFLADLRESVAILHKHQPYRGWCTLWVKDHQEHLGLMAPERQTRLAQDVAQVAAAMHEVLRPRRINYECLGNVVPHVHWHLIPRFDRPIDPDPGATVWVRPQGELECGVGDAVRDELVKALRDSIEARRRGPSGLNPLC